MWFDIDSSLGEQRRYSFDTSSPARIDVSVVACPGVDKYSQLKLILCICGDSTEPKAQHAARIVS
jgi:hypothetical protein